MSFSLYKRRKLSLSIHGSSRQSSVTQNTNKITPTSRRTMSSNKYSHRGSKQRGNLVDQSQLMLCKPICQDLLEEKKGQVEVWVEKKYKQLRDREKNSQLPKTPINKLIDFEFPFESRKVKAKGILVISQTL